MLGYLKTHLDYGPYYLTKEELMKRMSERIDIFYIQFARNVLLERSIEVYRRHKNDLDLLEIPLKHVKLLKYILIEMVRLPLIKILKSKGFVKQG